MPADAKASLYDRYTAFHHFRAVAGQGVVAGIFLLNEYVARKGLGATRWHVLALLLAPAVAQFVAAAWNPTDPRRLLGRAPFRLLGIPSRLLLLVFLVPALRGGPSAFVAILAASVVAEPLLLPVQNATLARNYSPATQGRRFGAASAVQALAIALVCLPAGLLLDRVPTAWPWLYAVAAVAGAYGYLHWSRLKRRGRRPRPATVRDHGSPWAALFEDRTFLAFEVAFMVYGLGYLMLQPVLPLYLVDELHVTYTQVGLARGLLFWTMMMVAGPLLGRLSDRIGIFRLGALSYLGLAGFPLILLLVPGAVGLDAGYASFGIAMAGVNVAWNLGPIVIAGDKDPLPYLNAHVALVGIRALVAMPLGAWLQRTHGSRDVFWCAVALELVAAACMYAVSRAWGKRP